MMNRKCRRSHQKWWKTKQISDNRRLVQCTKCGGVENEWKVKPDEVSSDSHGNAAASG